LFRDLLPGNGTVNVAKVQSNGGRAAATPEDEVSELAELRQLAETLRQSVRARDDFIAIAAHELRNPMTPIVGVAELALIAARKDGECVKLRQRPDGLFDMRGQVRQREVLVCHCHCPGSVVQQVASACKDPILAVRALSYAETARESVVAR
jgi:signal transduction histidine kinase